jgi:hypothetical protein
MARNAGGSRNGSVTGRTQMKTPSGSYIKRNAETGRLMGGKVDGSPYKGVAKENDGRRS